MRLSKLSPVVSLIFAGGLLCGCGDAGQGTQLDDLTAATCNHELDLGPLELSEQLCVVASLGELPQTAAAFAVTAHQLWLYGPGDAASDFSVTTHDLDLSQGTVGDKGTEALGFSAQLDEGVTAFPGGFLAVAPDHTAAVGYTRDSDFGGSVIVAADQSPTDLDSPGNYDAAWLDDDTLLVNGQGLGGGEPQQGLYAWQRQSDLRHQLVGNLGNASSFVARGDSVVFVGESAWPSNKLYAFTAEELQQALAERKTLDAKTDGDLVYEGEIIDATAVADSLVVLETSFDEDFAPLFGAVRRIGVAVQGASVSATEETELVMPGAGGSRPSALAAAGGLLAMRLEQGGGNDLLVIVKAK